MNLSKGIKHIRSTPYHPATNGAVERLVRTFKQTMRAGRHDLLSMQHRLQNFLLTYRATPHTTTGETPAMLFLGPTAPHKIRPATALSGKEGDRTSSFSKTAS